MPWSRSISAVVATLATSLTVYAIYVGLILRKISSFIHVCSPLSPGTAVPSPAAAAPAGSPGVEVFGFFIPLWWIVMLWLVLPLTWWSLELCHWIQRQNRERLGLCVDCGCRLISPWRGKCPMCGLRVGPD